MASSYLCVETCYNGVYKKWRTFGGNRSGVRIMYAMYNAMSYKDISLLHHNMTYNEWRTIKLRLHGLGCPIKYYGCKQKFLEVGMNELMFLKQKND